MFFLFLSGLFLGSMEQTLAERFGEIEREREQEGERASEILSLLPCIKTTIPHKDTQDACWDISIWTNG